MMMVNTISVDQVIHDARSWSHFESLLTSLTELEKGRVYERLVQLYLQSSPQYTTKLADVWLLNEVPLNVRNLLNLPYHDVGIDLIARTHEDEYWSIQAKYRTNPNSTLRLGGHGGLATFSSLSFVTCSNISLALVCSSTHNSVRNIDLLGDRVRFMGLTHWTGLDDDGGIGWQRVKTRIDGGILIPNKIPPRPFQIDCVTAIAHHFENQRTTRGKIVLPCGTGKSLIGFWVQQELDANNVLLVVPSLTLVSQALKTWTEQSIAHGDSPNWFAVCSDDSVGDRGRDQILSSVSELPFHSSTDPEEIADWLRISSPSMKLTIATYQSGPVLAEAARQAGISFDLAIMDEAHKTVGDRNKRFAHLLDPANLPVKRMLFMTATERVFYGNQDSVYTMDDRNVYGDLIYQMSFKAAIDAEIICDYEIRTVAVSSREVLRLWHENRFVRPIGLELDDLTAQSLTAHLALKRIIDDQNVRRIISFHRSVRGAKEFRDRAEQIFEPFQDNSDIKCFYVSGEQRTNIRNQTVQEFVGSERGILSNARCLNEGVDIPSVDCILFADPKRSTIDIVQAVGRALRKSPGKEKGTIVVPVLVPEDLDLEEFQEHTDFKAVISVIRAIATQDERIVEQVKAVLSGRERGPGPGFDIDMDSTVAERIQLADFAAAVDTRVWNQLKSYSWRPFEEAKEFAATTGCRTNMEWREYSKSGRLPFDIPSNPASIYKTTGWTTWGDWLGTGTIFSGFIYFRPFSEARSFVRSLNLPNQNAWQEYCRSGQRPDDIPSNAHRVYREQGWAGMGDWLGTGTISPQGRIYKPFSEAKEFIQSLGMKSNREWVRYCKSAQRPLDIPTHPHVIYKDQGWTSLGDWLGTGIIAPRLMKYREFEEARQFVRSLGLKGSNEWREYCGSGELPEDIPASPGRVYKDLGWVNMGDWTGSGRIANRFRTFRPFEDARTFVRTLNLTGSTAWRAYCRSGQVPLDIPYNPARTYKDQGWDGWGDWLGTGTVATRSREYRPFEEARKFVRQLALKDTNAWNDYRRSGLLPKDIPAAPQFVYKEAGWQGLRDWLGNA